MNHNTNQCNVCLATKTYFRNHEKELSDRMFNMILDNQNFSSKLIFPIKFYNENRNKTEN